MAEDAGFAGSVLFAAGSGLFEAFVSSTLQRRIRGLYSSPTSRRPPQVRAWLFHFLAASALARFVSCGHSVGTGRLAWRVCWQQKYFCRRCLAHAPCAVALVGLPDSHT